MARRPRVHSRDIQPQLATPKGLLAVARVQRFDWPLNLPTETIDELGRKLHVGKTQQTPEVTVTVEAFDVSHRTISYLTGYTPSTFPTPSGISITELKSVDVIGQIRDSSTLGIVNALYVKRGTITGMDASFGVRDNSTVTFTVTANSKKELRNPVYYENFVVSSGSTQTLSQAPVWLPVTSGYILSAYRTTSAGSSVYLDEGVDFTVAGSNVTFQGTGVGTGDTVWVTYTSTTAKTFEALNDVDPAAVQGKYVPLVISVSTIPRAQSATIRLAYDVENIYELGGLGKPVGTELGVPNVTGDVSVLKTDNDLVNLLTGQPTTADETDMEYAKNNLPLKVQLKDPRNTAQVLLTYYVPSITITSEGDSSSVNQSMTETFAWESTTGDLYIASGAGPW